MIFFSFICILIGIILSFIFGTAGIVVVNILCLLILLVISRGINDKIYLHLAVIFVISTLIMLELYYGYIDMFGYPYMSGWNNDDSNFELAREYIVSSGYLFPWQIDFYLVGANNSKGYITLLSWLTYITKWAGNYHTVMPRLLNIYLLIITGILVYKFIVKYYNFNYKYNLCSLYAVVLFPNSLYISAHVFRDTLVSFILFSVFYICDKYNNVNLTNKCNGCNCIYLDKYFKKIIIVLFHVILILVIGYISYTIRYESIYFIIFIVIVSLFIKNDNLSLKTFLSYLMVGVIVFYVFYKTGFIETLILRHVGYTDYRFEDNTGLSQIVFGIPIFPAGLLLRIGYALVSPIPIPIVKIFNMFSDTETLFQVLCSAGTIVQFFLLPYLLYSLKKLDKISLIFCSILLAISLTTFTFRHFIMLYPFMTVLIFRELKESTKETRTRYFIFQLIFLILLATIYFITKY